MVLQRALLREHSCWLDGLWSHFTCTPDPQQSILYDDISVVCILLTNAEDSTALVSRAHEEQESRFPRDTNALRTMSWGSCPREGVRKGGALVCISERRELSLAPFDLGYRQDKQPEERFAGAHLPEVAVVGEAGEGPRGHRACSHVWTPEGLTLFFLVRLQDASGP